MMGKMDRRPFTFNEFVNAAISGPSNEYRDGVASGRLQEFNQTRRDEIFNPQQEFLGGSATNSGLNLNELVNNNPLIEFQRSENERFTSRAAAARGLNESGGTLLELQDRNNAITAAGVQDFVLNPLFQLAGFGPQASGQLNQTANNVGGNLANIALGTGASRASAFQNKADTTGNMISNFANLPLLMQYAGGRG
jgi:hypothetical protein